MNRFRTVTLALTVAAVTTFGAGLVALVGATPAGATGVADETALRAAFADASETAVVLTADVELTCVGGGELARTSAVPVTVDGQGRFSITQTCPDVTALAATGAGGVTLHGVTIVGGNVGLVADGPVDVSSSHLTGQRSSVGPVAGIAIGPGPGGGPLTMTDSVIDDVVTTDPDAIAYGALALGTTTTMTGVRIADLTGGSGAIGLFTYGAQVVDSTVADLSGDAAVGVFSAAFGAEVRGSTITRLTGSASEAVGLYVDGVTTVVDSAVTRIVGVESVGVDWAGPGGSIVRSTVAQISGTTSAVGVLEESGSGTVTVVNSTVADVTGPGVVATDLVMTYSTVRATGGADAPTLAPQVDAVGTLTIFGSVVTAPRSGAPDCAVGTTVSAGYNFVDDTSCALSGPGDRQGAGLDPQLGPLADNGGPGPTFLPLTGSPLLDAIPLEACQTGPAAGITTDERGEPRPSFLGCDIGAVEVQIVLRFTG